MLKSRKKQVRYGQAEITDLVGASDPEPRAGGVCSRGRTELWKVGCQSLIKITPVFQAIRWVTISKTVRQKKRMTLRTHSGRHSKPTHMRMTEGAKGALEGKGRKAQGKKYHTKKVGAQPKHCSRLAFCSVYEHM